MIQRPLVSVALCTYNGARFLKQQLESVLAQSYSHLEIVCVDDRSNDETVALLQDFAAKDNRIRLFQNERNLGYTKNFEKALGLCSAELIAICDQDDIWHQDKISSQVEAIGQNLLIYHDSSFVDESGNSLDMRISDRFNFYRGNDPRTFLYLNCVSGHSILFKRSILDSALPFPMGFHYDQWLVFVAANEGSIDFLAESLVEYRQHDTNSTDILARRASSDKGISKKIAAINKESEWLKICSEKAVKFRPLISNLHQLSTERTHSFASVSYGLAIWKNKESLLYLLKKNSVSKFFYTLRKVWGARAKRVTTTKG